MCGPHFSPGRGFGQKSRRRSRDLAGTLPATTARARGGWSRKSAPEAAQCPPGTTFPAWPFLGPAASFAAGSSARRLVERNGARQRRAAQPSAAPPRHTIPIEVAQRNKLSISIISIAGPGSSIPSSLFSHFVIEVSGTRGIGIIVDLSKPAPACRLPQALGKALGTMSSREATIRSFRARSVKVVWDGAAPPSVEALQAAFAPFGAISTVRVKQRTALVLYRDARSVASAVDGTRGPWIATAVATERADPRRGSLPSASFGQAPAAEAPAGASEPPAAEAFSGGAPFGQAPAAETFSGAPFGQAPAAEAPAGAGEPRPHRSPRASPRAACVALGFGGRFARGGGGAAPGILRLGRLCDLGGDEVVLFGVARASPAALAAALRRTEVLATARCGLGGDDGGVAGRLRVAHAALLCDAGQSDAALSRCAATCTAAAPRGPARTALAAAVALEDRVRRSGDGSAIPRAALAAAAAPSSLDQLGSRAGGRLNELTAAEAAPAPAPVARPPSPAAPAVLRPARTDAIDAKPGWFRRKLSAVLYPDATRVDLAEASAPAAYYDKACGRWILPDTDGKDGHSTAAPPLRAPPPSASMRPPGLAPAGQSSPPLPSPRRAASTSAMAADPLAAMMAPPPMRAVPRAHRVGDAMTIRAPQSQSTPSFATFA